MIERSPATRAGIIQSKPTDFLVKMARKQDIYSCPRGDETPFDAYL
ncbi:hypothetical protein [Zymomonas mobilis]